MKNKDLKFYKRGHFIYVESADYLIEFDFSEFGMTEIVIKIKTGIIIDWKKNAKEIKESTFLKYYNLSKKRNPFTPVL